MSYPLPKIGKITRWQGSYVGPCACRLASASLIRGALVGSVAGPMLRVDNNSTRARATVLDLQVEAGKPPMKINSGAEVARLNGDSLDGIDSTALGATIEHRGGSTHVCATKLSPPYGQWNEHAPITVKVLPVSSTT